MARSAPSTSVSAGASARYIAAALSRGATEEVPRIFGTGLLAQSCIGITGGSVVAAATPLLVVRLFALPPDLQSDGYAIVRLIGLAVPLVLLSNSLRSALYAAQRLDLVNAVGVPASSSMYLLCAVGALAGWTLPTTVAVLVTSKAVALAALSELGMLVLLAAFAAPRVLRPTYLLDSLRLDVTAVVGFVTIVGVTSVWLRGSAFAYVAFASKTGATLLAVDPGGESRQSETHPELIRDARSSRCHPHHATDDSLV